MSLVGSEEPEKLENMEELFLDKLMVYLADTVSFGHWKCLSNGFGKVRVCTLGVVPCGTESMNSS